MRIRYQIGIGCFMGVDSLQSAFVSTWTERGREDPLEIDGVGRLLATGGVN
jgi:hypothetical protein